MKFSNADIRVFREEICVDSSGRRIKNCKDYPELGIIKCVRYTQDISELAKKQEFEQDIERGIFRYHSNDQETIIDVKKNDYIAFYYDTIPYYFKVKKQKTQVAFKMKSSPKLSYAIYAERIDPKQCPKPIRSNVISDRLV